jgi:hypothetical protein
MTDSHSPTPHASQPPGTPAHQGHSYEGFDPDLPEEKHSQESRAARVSTVQVGASAAAAVTSALAASFFGVAGTLIGAAVGSVVSTVAGALYADYLRRAGSRLRTTSTVVVQRLPSEVLTTTPLRHLTGPVGPQPHSAATDSRNPANPANPAAVPGRAALQPVRPDSEQTVAVPLATPEEIQQASTSFDPSTMHADHHLSETQLIPRITAETITQPAVTGANSTPVPVGAGGGPNGRAPQVAPAGPGGSGPLAPDPDPGRRPWWRRPPVMLTALGAICFLVAIGVVTAVELGIGHPLSDSHVKGTSISRTVEGKTTSSTPTPTVTVTVTPSASASQPAATASPAATATGTPAPTATSTPTATATGQSTGQPTGTVQATSTAGDLAPVASSTP